MAKQLLRIHLRLQRAVTSELSDMDLDGPHASGSTDPESSRVAAAAAAADCSKLQGEFDCCPHLAAMRKVYVAKENQNPRASN